MWFADSVCYLVLFWHLGSCHRYVKHSRVGTRLSVIANEMVDWTSQRIRVPIVQVFYDRNHHSMIGWHMPTLQCCPHSRLGLTSRNVVKAWRFLIYLVLAHFPCSTYTFPQTCIIHASRALVFDAAKCEGNSNSDFSLQPYTTGRSDIVLKWKPPSHNSIDFKLQIKKWVALDPCIICSY